MEKVLQGAVLIDGSTRITCTSGLLTITTLIVNNPSEDYHFLLTKVTDEQIPLYRFDLEAGDTLRDTYNYRLQSGESLQLITNVEGTTFYINATEQ